MNIHIYSCMCIYMYHFFSRNGVLFYLLVCKLLCVLFTRYILSICPGPYTVQIVLVLRGGCLIHHSLCSSCHMDGQLSHSNFSITKNTYLTPLFVHLCTSAFIFLEFISRNAYAHFTF